MVKRQLRQMTDHTLERNTEVDHIATQFTPNEVEETLQQRLKWLDTDVSTQTTANKADQNENFSWLGSGVNPSSQLKANPLKT